MKIAASLVAFMMATTSASCGGKPTPKTPVATPRAPSLLESVAAEIDPGAQPALWSRLPASRLELERGVNLPADAAARIQEAKARLATWDQTMDTSSSEAVTARVVAGLEALYMAETVVFAGDPSAWSEVQREGAGLLHELYARLDQPTLGPWLREPGRVLLDMSLLEKVLTEAPTMRRYLAAALLRAGGPDGALFVILRDQASRKLTAGDVAGARALYDEVVRRRGRNAGVVDWIEAGLGRVRSEDLPAAVAALEEATSRARATPEDRNLGARVRGLRLEVRTLERYLAAKPATDIERKLARLDLLHAFSREPEARMILDELEKAHPKDARVRVRKVVLDIDAMAASNDVLKASQLAAQALEAPDLENLDGDYWSLVAGTLGFRAMTDVLATFQMDKVAGAQRMIELLQYLRGVAGELAKTRPGRAAALEALASSAIAVFSGGKPLEDQLGLVLQSGFGAALSLKQQHPTTADVARILYSFAPYADNLDQSLAAVVELPGTSPDDDADLYLQRAHVAVAIARQLATPDATARACATVDDIPPTFDTPREGARAALLGDCAGLVAVTANDAAAWPRAIEHYAAALSLDRLEDDRPRILHNLAYAVLQTGDREGAIARFTEAAAAESNRRFLPRFHLLSLTATSPAERLTGLRELSRELAAANEPASYLGTWLAHLSDDPAEAATTASHVLEQMADKLRAPSPASFGRGLESQGTFQLGLGVASRQLYALNAQVYSSVWFVVPPPLDRAALEVKAKAKVKTKTKTKPPRLPRKP